MPFPIAIATGIAAQFAPQLVSLFAGNKAGKVADTVGQIAQAVTKADKPEDILKALHESAQLRQEFQWRVAQAQVEILKEENADRESARRRQVDMKDWTINALAFLILAAWGYLNYTILTNGLPSGVSESVTARILGMLDATTMAVVYYFFGSSKGSADKTAILMQGSDTP